MPRFDLEGFLGLVQEHRATKAHLVPPIVLALAKSPVVERYDLSSLSSSTPAPRRSAPSCSRRPRERIGCPVVQGYGMTESSPVTHVTPLDPARHRLGSIGPPVPNTECRIVDVASGEELGARRGGRGVRARAAGHARLPRRPRGDRRHRRRRRLAAHRRRRPRRRGRLRRARRPRQGAHQVQGLPGGAGRARGGARRASRPWPRPRSSGAPTRRPARCPRPSWRSPARRPRRRSWPSSPSAWRPTRSCARVEVVDEIPKSPSGKILRRVLKERDT